MIQAYQVGTCHKGAAVNDRETTWRATKIRSSAKERDIKTSEYNGTQYVIQVIKSPIF